MKLGEWLAAHPGPHDVFLGTVKPGVDPFEYSAGTVLFSADTDEIKSGIVFFYQIRGGETVGSIALVEAAIVPDEQMPEDGTFTGDYRNLVVPNDEFEEFYPYARLAVCNRQSKNI